MLTCAIGADLVDPSIVQARVAAPQQQQPQQQQQQQLHQQLHQTFQQSNVQGTNNNTGGYTNIIYGRGSNW